MHSCDFHWAVGWGEGAGITMTTPVPQIRLITTALLLLSQHYARGALENHCQHPWGLIPTLKSADHINYGQCMHIVYIFCLVAHMCKIKTLCTQ